MHVQENSVNSSNDENGASSVTGWEVALFTEPETSNDNVVAESTFTEQGVSFLCHFTSATDDF